jgi:hypothetical protein
MKYTVKERETVRITTIPRRKQIFENGRFFDALTERRNCVEAINPSFNRNY